MHITLARIKSAASTAQKTVDHTKRILVGLINLALPVCCVLCQKPLTGSAQAQTKPADKWLCDDCQPLLNVLSLEQACIQCAIPLEHDHQGDICARCLRFPPQFDAITCAYYYGYPLDHIIHSCKEHNQPYIANHLGKQLACLMTCQQDKLTVLPDILTCVPMHPTKWLSRQFNPAQIIAKASHTHLADHAGAKKIHFMPKLLLKNTATHTQKGLSRKARLKNLNNSFSVNADMHIHGLHITVVDDVVTTTATAHIISTVLKKAGAATVTFWAVARTPNK